MVEYDEAEDPPMGKMLILSGLGLIVLGVLFNAGFGRLPGDIYIRGRNGAFYFPIVTCLLISALLSLVMWLFNRR